MLPSKLVFRTKSAQTKLASTAVNAARRLLPDLSTLSQQNAGGVIRKVSVATVDTFGKVALQVAQESYKDLRAVAVSTAYTSQLLKFQAEQVVDPLIGASMLVYQQGKFAEAESLILNGLDRAVSDVFRQQMVQDSYDDSQATGYQRVPSPDCCAFCAVVALNEYTSFDESGGYHNACGCTTIPIFKTLGAFRPSYYDQLESDYTDATASVDSTKTEDILAAMRQQSGRS